MDQRINDQANRRICQQMLNHSSTTHLSIDIQSHSTIYIHPISSSSTCELLQQGSFELAVLLIEHGSSGLIVSGVPVREDTSHTVHRTTQQLLGSMLLEEEGHLHAMPPLQATTDVSLRLLHIEVIGSQISQKHQLRVKTVHIQCCTTTSTTTVGITTTSTTTIIIPTTFNIVITSHPFLQRMQLGTVLSTQAVPISTGLTHHLLYAGWIEIVHP